MAWRVCEHPPGLAEGKIENDDEGRLKRRNEDYGSNED